VLNTRDIGSQGQASDGAEIRMLATENNVTIFTALDTVRVLLDVLEETTLTISTIDARFRLEKPLCTALFLKSGLT
jgi:carbamoyl-phosphate synthase large subunit